MATGAVRAGLGITDVGRLSWVAYVFDLAPPDTSMGLNNGVGLSADGGGDTVLDTRTKGSVKGVAPVGAKVVGAGVAPVGAEVVGAGVDTEGADETDGADGVKVAGVAPEGAKVAGTGVDTEGAEETEGEKVTEGAEETAGAGEAERMEGDGADETEGAGARKPGGGPTLGWTRPRPAAKAYVVAGLTLPRIIGILGVPSRDGTEVDVGGDGEAWLTFGRSGDGGADLDLAGRTGGSWIAAK